MASRTGDDEASERFWDAVEQLLARSDVTRSTMMGYPCLRTSGAFFACFNPRDGALVVKLPAIVVAELIASDAAQPFAPNGHAFKEWASIPSELEASWSMHLDEAYAFVRSLPPPQEKRPTRRRRSS